MCPTALAICSTDYSVANIIISDKSDFVNTFRKLFSGNQKKLSPPVLMVLFYHKIVALSTKNLPPEAMLQEGDKVRKS